METTHGKYYLSAALFDMDGTLIDSETLSAFAWKEAGRRLNIPMDDKFIEGIRGLNKAFQRVFALNFFGADFDFESAHDLHSDIMKEYFDKNGVPLKNGAKELLDYLKDINMPMALATSTRVERASDEIKKAGLYGYFSAFVYGNEVINSKPDPEIFLTAAQRLGKNICDCGIFEDSENGLKAAILSGAKVFCIPDITNINEETKRKCNEIFTALYEAAPFILKKETL